MFQNQLFSFELFVAKMVLLDGMFAKLKNYLEILNRNLKTEFIVKFSNISQKLEL